jgi:hypothetical protein
MSDKINRTSRASVEVKKERLKPWTPPSSLDAPPAPDGYCHRWIRTESMGFQDTANVSKKNERRLGICESRRIEKFYR